MSNVDDARAFLKKTNEGLLELTEAGHEEIGAWVTDSHSNVYAFMSEADDVTVAAAMARLSRNPNKLLTIILSEFLKNGGKDSELLERVVTQYGDDSVMQLFPMQVVFENISNLATKQVEWGRLAAYLEQSTRYMRFDTKDADGHYAYYTPTELDADTAAEYEVAMDEIFDIYSAMYQKMYAYLEKTNDTPVENRDAPWRRAVHAQTCDNIRSLLPASTKATVAIVGSSQAMQNMIHNLQAHPLPEMNQLATQALDAVRAVAPVFFQRTDKPEQGGLIVESKKSARTHSRALAAELLGVETTPVQGPGVTVLSVNGTEDDLVVKIMADSSDLSYEFIREKVATLTDAQKQSVITAYVGERYNRRVKPGRAFEAISYVIEGRIDYGGFRDIQRSRMVDAFEWQPLQTKLGYICPPVIDEAGLTEEYKKAFAISARMYDLLQDRGYVDQAQYATLFGHIVRTSMVVNARSLFHTIELRTTPQGHSTYREFYQNVHAEIAKVHPNIAKAMRFVNMDEDAGLAREGAERYYEAKRIAAEHAAKA